MATITVNVPLSSFVSDSSISGAVWGSPANAAVDDGTYSSANTVLGITDQTQRLTATKAATLIVSPDSKFVGATTNVNGKDEEIAINPTLYNDLIVNNAIIGTQKSSNLAGWIDVTRTFGSESDTWNAAIKANDINMAGFGTASYLVNNGTNDGIRYIDFMSMTVTVEPGNIMMAM